MSEQRVLFLQKSLIGMCALAALVVFIGFCAVVNGAVDRAARHRLALVDPALNGNGTSPRTAADTARSNALLARVGN
ncbi:MAG TPA: hypothetical protein VH041_18570 [Caldimonas sp.]|jgi:hypothetical protein|nr:hypothetical protein [Caldimonas sp.]HEX4236298.1 hypothetical protein [Caldimonas sp.]